MDVGGGFLGSLIVTLGADTSGLLLAQRAVDKTAATMSRRMSVLGRDMQMAGRNMTFGLTMPLLLLQKTSIDVFAKFENNITKINGLVGVSKVLTQQWAEQIKSMAVEIGRTPIELSDALYFITSAGITGAESMTILRESAKAATAGLGDTKIVADLVTSAINAFGRSNLSARDTVEALVATVREGKAEPEDLAKSMGIVLPVAALIGMKFQEVGASIAAMTRSGIKAGTAAIYLRQTLNTLLKPSKQTSDGLAQIGLTAVKVRNDIENNGFLQTLIKIKDATSENIEVLGQIFPNLRAYTGVVSILGKNLKDTTEIFKDLTDNTGDLGKAFDVAHNTLFSLKQISAQLQAVSISLGETFAKALIPLFQSLMSFATKVTEAFKNLSPSMQTVVASFVALLTVAGPLVWMLGSTVQAAVALGPAFIALKLAALNTVIGIRALTTAMMANPYLAAGAAIIGLVLIINKLIKVQNQLSAEQQMMVDINKTATKEVLSQKVAFDQLMVVASNTNATYAQRQEAIKRINDLLPEHLKGINLESIAYGKAQMAIRQYLEELKKESALRALQAEREKIEADRIEQLSNPQHLTTYNKVALGLIVGLKQYTNSFSKDTKSFMDSYREGEKNFLDNTENLQKAHYENLISIIDTKQKEILGITDTFVNERAKIIANSFKLDLLGGTTGDLGKGTIAPLAPNPSRAALENAGKQQSLMQKYVTDMQVGRDAAVQLIMDNYIITLGVLDEKYKVMGDSQDYYTNKLKELDTTITALIPLLGTEDAEILKLKKDYDATTKALEIYNSASKASKPEDIYADYQKSIKDINNLYKDWGSSLDYLKDKLKEQEDTIKKLNATSWANSDIVKQLKTDSEATALALESLIDASKLNTVNATFATFFNSVVSYQKDMKTLNTEYAIFGDNQDYLQNKLSKLHTFIIALSSVFGTNSVIVQNLKQSYDDLKKTLEDVQGASKVMTFEEVQKKLKKDLEDNVAYSKLLGSSYGESEKAIEFYSEALQSMMAIKPEKWTEEMRLEAQAYQSAIISLKEETASYTSVVRELGSVFTNLSSLINELFPEENGFTKFLKTIGKGIYVISSLMRVTESVGKIMSWLGVATSITTGAEVAKTAAQTAGIPITTAATVAATNLAIAEAAASGAMVPFPGTIPAITANLLAVTGGITAARAAMMGLMAVPGLAEGGMVPDGYPNDSFFARLSSKETVIPLNKMPEFGGGQNINVRVEPIIKGTDIHWVVKEVERKYANSF